MTILFALLTSLTNALAVTLQHIASPSRHEEVFGMEIRPLPLHAPTVGTFAGSHCAAHWSSKLLALHFGPLSVVQPVLVTELIIALVLRQLWLHQSIRIITWMAAVVTGGGLVIFLITTSPHAHGFAPTSSRVDNPIDRLRHRRRAARCARPARFAFAQGCPVRERDRGHVGARGHVHQGHHRLDQCGRVLGRIRTLAHLTP